MLFLVRAHIIVACVFASGGCASVRPMASSESAITVVDQFPASASVSSTKARSQPYLIGPRDLLQVRILGNEELDVDARVDNGGMINLPLVGSVQASGKTPVTLNAELTTLYHATYLKNPRVSVTVAEINSQNVTVGGSVRKPGVYPVVPGVTLSTALAMAEGATEFAALDNVAIFRTIEGQRMAAVFSVKDIRRGLYADPEILPSDSIVVGDAPVKRMFRDFISLAPFIAAFRPFGP